MCVLFYRALTSTGRISVYTLIVLKPISALAFYSASAMLAMQSAVLARGILSVRLSVRPPVRPSRSGIASR